MSRAGESARPGLRDKEGCLCRQMREYPRGDSEGERPPSVEWLGSEPMVVEKPEENGTVLVGQAGTQEPHIFLQHT